MKGVIYCDGGSNQFGSIYCVMTDYEYKKWAAIRRFKKRFNVMQIEYLALIAALEKCTKETPLIFTDNLRVFREVNKKKLWVHGSKNKELWKSARRLMKKKSYVKVKWVSRDENLAGIYLDEILWKKKEEKFGIPRDEINEIYKILNERKSQRNNSH